MQTVCFRFPKVCGRNKLNKVAVWKFEDFKTQKCSNRWIPLKKAVMLYLTVRKPTCFKCYRLFFRTLQNCTIHMNISDKLTTDLIINTFQYLFDFLFSPGKVNITSTNFSTCEKHYKMLFLFLFKSQCRHHADWAPQELQTAISQAQYQKKQRSPKSYPLSLCQHKYGDLSALSLLNYFSPCIQRDGLT